MDKNFQQRANRNAYNIRRILRDGSLPDEDKAQALTKMAGNIWKEELSFRPELTEMIYNTFEGIPDAEAQEYLRNIVIRMLKHGFMQGFGYGLDVAVRMSDAENS